MHPELHHAIEVKKGLTLRSHSAFLEARRRFPATHEVLNLVTPCVCVCVW